VPSKIAAALFGKRDERKDELSVQAKKPHPNVRLTQIELARFQRRYFIRSIWRARLTARFSWRW
jgi:hypothetical protein